MTLSIMDEEMKPVPAEGTEPDRSTEAIAERRSEKARVAPTWAPNAVKTKFMNYVPRCSYLKADMDSDDEVLDYRELEGAIDDIEMDILESLKLDGDMLSLTVPKQKNIDLKRDFIKASAILQERTEEALLQILRSSGGDLLKGVDIWGGDHL